MNARFVALVAGVFFFFLAVVTQGILPFVEPSARTNRRDRGGPHRFGPAQMDVDRGHRLHAAATARPARVSARGLLVLPFPIRASGDRRDAPLGSGERGRRIRLRRAAPVRHPAHRAGPDAGRAQIRRRVASTPISGIRACSPRIRSWRRIGACSMRPRSRSRSSMTGPAIAPSRRRRSPQALFDFGSKEQIKLTPNADGLLFVPHAGARQVPADLDAQQGIHRRHGQDRRRNGRARGPDRLCAEARYEPRQVARPVRAAGDRGHGRHPTALGRMDRLRQGGLRAAVHRLPRRQRRRQRAGCDLLVQPAPAELQRGRLQVQADPEAGADRWRPAADHHPWRARHSDAGLV